MDNSYCNEFRKVIDEFNRLVVDFGVAREEGEDVGSLMEKVKGIRTFCSSDPKQVLEGGVKIFVGNLDFGTVLKFDKPVVFPAVVLGYLDLNELEDGLNIQFPKYVARNLSLDGLTTPDGLNLPIRVGKGLFLSGLITAKGVRFPESVGGQIDLRSLTTIDGLELPEKVGADIFLDSLSDEAKHKLRKKYPIHKNKII